MKIVIYPEVPDEIKIVNRYAISYEDFAEQAIGRPCKTPEAQRRKIDKLLDDLMRAYSFDDLQEVLELLKIFTQYDDRAFEFSHTLYNMRRATPRELRRIGTFTSHMVEGGPKSAKQYSKYADK